MRQPKLFTLLLILFLAGCTGSGSDRHLSRGGSETVLITYHVAPGKEPELTRLLVKAWDVYRQEKLVFAEPHVVLQDSATAGSRELSKSSHGSAHHLLITHRIPSRSFGIRCRRVAKSGTE